MKKKEGSLFVVIKGENGEKKEVDMKKIVRSEDKKKNKNSL